MVYKLTANQSKLVGIYKISSNIDDRIYVGSAVGFRRRYASHLSCLQNGKHDNSRLQNFVNKYGIDSLTFEIIEVCQRENLIEREQYYIDTLSPFFNIARVAGNTQGLKPWAGRKHSEETKQKMSKSNLRKNSGKKMSEEAKRKISEFHKGNKYSLGKKLSEEHKEKLRIAFSGERNHNFGKKRSAESRKKMSEAKKGEKCSWFGRKHTEETRQKMSVNNGRTREIGIFNENNEVVMHFPQMKQLADYLGVGLAAVCNAIRRNNLCKGNKIGYINA